jgi:ABC-type multidrug transport system fused ATPase/permease subunit
MTQDLAPFTWAAAQLGQAIEALARKRGLAPEPMQIPVGAQAIGGNSLALREWIHSAAQWFGLEAEPLDASYDTVEQIVRGAGPALVLVPQNGEAKFLALLGGNGKAVSLLCPNLKVTAVKPEVILAALLESVEAPLQTEILRLIEHAGIPKRRQPRAWEALIRERLRSRPIASCWTLHLSPGASFWPQLRQAHLPGRMVLLVGAYAMEYALWILSWWLIGLGALEGRFDRGWLLAWGLLLLTIVPFRLLGSWLQGVLSIGTATLLKRRLLYGALRLVPEEIRHQGAGQFLGQVFESEAVESMALSGGFVVLISAIELSAAIFVLGWGTSVILLRLLLVGWVLLALFLSHRYYLRRQVWTTDRLKMTHDLIERMVGHRTRMAQESQEHWHDGEDEALERYLEISEDVDRSALWLTALVPRGWLIVALMGLAPAFASSRSSPINVAIALGGLLLGYRALVRLSTGLWSLIDAAVSWKQVAPLFHAAARPRAVGLPLFDRAEKAQTAENRHKLVEAHDLSFRYGDRGEPVLRKCSLSIGVGDRVLLEGHSGSGKSTLASLLVGMRTPQSGLLLLEGLDWQTLGMDGWRRRIVSAPQFHENHVLTETLAFNLLMGRRWPPLQKDMNEAEEICRELGLGQLIEHMPAGLLQMVGETGWQLSHGERSLLYVARALLQRAQVVILDESFAALDPETLKRSLNCVLHRASTLMVIAHP